MEQELKEAKERIAELEACLIRIAKMAWCAVKDELDSAESSVTGLRWTIKEMEKAGLSAWLPSFADTCGALNKREETLAEARKRREFMAIEIMIKIPTDSPKKGAP